MVPSVVEGASRDDGVAQVELVAAPATKVVAGRTVELLTYNGAFPGPLLRFRERDRVRVRLTNRLGEPTNLHFHGLHIPPAADDPALLVADGETIDYEFELPAGSAGTYWYHPHAHGAVAPQLFAGLAGPLLIDGRDDPTSWADADEQILFLKDLAIEGSHVSPHSTDDWLNGKEGDLLLVNGELQPHIAPSNGLLRLRLINACNARYLLLGVEDHQLAVISAGTGFAGRPSMMDALLLSPGERTDVLVAFHRTGVFRLVALPYDRGADMSGMDDTAHTGEMGTAMSGMDMGSMDMGSMGSMDDMARIGERGTGETFPGRGHPPAAHIARLGNLQPIKLATLAATQSGPPLELPDDLASLPPSDPDNVKVRRQIVLSEGMGRGPVRFLINGKTFEPKRIDFRSQRGSIEIWGVINDADMDHPFHLHSYPFIVLSRNGRPEPVRMWRDTVNVTAGGRVELFIPFEDFTGTTIYHCHIVEHEDRGMMAQFAVVSGNEDQ